MNLNSHTEIEKRDVCWSCELVYSLFKACVIAAILTKKWLCKAIFIPILIFWLTVILISYEDQPVVVGAGIKLAIGLKAG